MIYHGNSCFINMRESGKILSRVFRYIKKYLKPGITTNEINHLCHYKILSMNATSACLHYHGYPKSICTSINNVVCHGIPSNRKLNNGDILNIDISINYFGWHSDCSKMFIIGQVHPHVYKLINVVYNAMFAAINLLRPGIYINSIGNIIENHVNLYGFNVVKDYCGHGIGKKFHEYPNILHCANLDNLLLKKGMFFTIEPIVNIGSGSTILLSDNWTVVTADNSLSAQFEHTIGITDTGCEIFT